MLRKQHSQDSPTVDRKTFLGARSALVGTMDSPTGVVDLYPVVLDIDEMEAASSCCLAGSVRDTWEDIFPKTLASRDNNDGQRGRPESEREDFSGLPPLPDISVTPHHRSRPPLTNRPSIVCRNSSHESKASHRSGRTVDGSESSGLSNQIQRFQDHYVLTRQLFQCQRSTVCECVHRLSGQRYCVKLCSSAHEVRMLQAAQGHNHIVRLNELINSGKKRVYMVMEYMASGNLLSLVVQNERLQEDAIRNIMRQVLKALHHLHTVANMTHNDLCPANILLQKDGDDWVVKLSDFGAARRLNKTNSAKGSTLTPSWYRAPEQTPSEASDVWSVGALILFCWHRDTDFDPFRIHQGLSRPCKQFLAQAIALDPEVRFTANEALEHKWLASSSQGRPSVIVRGQPRWRQIWRCWAGHEGSSAETSLVSSGFS